MSGIEVSVTGGFEEPLGGWAAVVVVYDGGEWIGDFTMTFERRFGSDYVADGYSSVRAGNGLYVEDDPMPWVLEQAALLVDRQKRFGDYSVDIDTREKYGDDDFPSGGNGETIS